jgi:hypothetical protein
MYAASRALQTLVLCAAACNAAKLTSCSNDYNSVNPDGPTNGCAPGEQSSKATEWVANFALLKRLWHWLSSIAVQSCDRHSVLTTAVFWRGSRCYMGKLGLLLS